MKLSIIIPVFNTGESACRLINSLLPQEDDMEIIAVDDGSRDDSLALLKKLAKKDKRIKVISQKNGGASSARNAGINISQGEYLAFVDSDDEVGSQYVKKMLGGLEKDRHAMASACAVEYHRLATGAHEAVYTSPIRKRKNREKFANYILYLFCRDGRIYGSVNKIFRGEIIRKYGLRFEEGRDFAEDTKFVLDYLAACRNEEKYSSGDIIFVLDPIYIYNFGTPTSTVKKSSLRWENWEKSYQDLLVWTRNETGDRLGLKTRMLLGLVRIRWHISHHRALKRSKSKQPSHAGKFIVVGVALTIFDFLVCTILVRFIFRTNDMHEVSTIISTALTTVLAYFLHSRITWRERRPSGRGMVMFFLWNALTAVAIKPLSVWIFGLFTGLYQFAFMISNALHLPFDYDTVEYLGIYALATVVTMTLNFFFYDRLVFGKKN